MNKIYTDYHKDALFVNLQKAKTESEISAVCDAIAEMWVALGCPADM